jgi:hypothetical protein
MSGMEAVDERSGRPFGSLASGLGTGLGMCVACVGGLGVGVGLPVLWWGSAHVGGPVFAFGALALIAAVPAGIVATAMPRLAAAGLGVSALFVGSNGAWWLATVLLPLGVAFLLVPPSPPVGWRVQARWVLAPAPIAFLAGLAFFAWGAMQA